jgi:hypothetical protein
MRRLTSATAERTRKHADRKEKERIATEDQGIVNILRQTAGVIARCETSGKLLEHRLSDRAFPEIAFEFS